jgi:hypothetical protein
MLKKLIKRMKNKSQELNPARTFDTMKMKKLYSKFHIPHSVVNLRHSIFNILYSKLKRLLPTRKSRLIAAAVVILILAPIVVNTLLSSRKVQAAWWNQISGGGSWLKRQNISLINNSGDSLATGTTVAVNVDTKSLVAQGKLQSDCDDLRVVYTTNGTTHTELTRYLSYPGGSSCSTSEATKVYFKLQATLPDGSSNADTNYYIYYDNTQATTPTSTVHAFDTANDTALLVCPFDGTTTCVNGNGAVNPTTATGAIRYSGAKSAVLFDGKSGDRITASSGPSLNSTSFTVEMWINPQIGSGDSDQVTMNLAVNTNGNFQPQIADYGTGYKKFNLWASGG